MQTFYSEDHRLHHANAELNEGQLMPCFEMPSRADMVLAQVKRTELGPISAPLDYGIEPIKRIQLCRFHSDRLAALERIGPGT